MSEDHRVTLQTILDQLREDNAPLVAPDAFFEQFSAEQALKSLGLELDSEQLASGNYDGEEDGGVDGLFLFINRTLVREDTAIDKVDVSKVTTIELVLIQSTRHAGFKEKAIHKFADFADRCLRTQADHDQVRNLYDESLLEIADKFRQLYRRTVVKRPTVSIRFFYATMGDQADQKVTTQARLLEDSIRTWISPVLIDVVFAGAQFLLETFSRQPETTLKLEMKRGQAITDLGGVAYLGVVTLKKFREFLCDPHGNLREHIFESNVRDYAQDVKVNKAIRGTLTDTQSEDDFWWLNNGVTVIAAKATGAPELLAVTDPLIVNGLQTSYEVYENAPHDDDKRSVLLRVIETTDAETMDRIINATNNQTKIAPASLHATEPLHRNIELYFKANDLFYERRKNYYRRRNFAATKIIPIQYLAQTLAAIVLQRPDDAMGRPTTVLERDYKKLFYKNSHIDLYLKCARLQRKTEAEMRTYGLSRLDFANLRFYVSMIASCLATKSAEPTRAKIANINVNDVTSAMLLQAFTMARAEYDALGGGQKVSKGPVLLNRLLTLLEQQLGVRRSPIR